MYLEGYAAFLPRVFFRERRGFHPELEPPPLRENANRIPLPLLGADNSTSFLQKKPAAHGCRSFTRDDSRRLAARVKAGGRDNAGATEPVSADLIVILHDFTAAATKEPVGNALALVVAEFEAKGRVTFRRFLDDRHGRVLRCIEVKHHMQRFPVVVRLRPVDPDADSRQPCP